MSGAEHWNAVYLRRAPEELSWFQREAALSLELIEAAALPREAAIVDVGAGASTLVDGLLARGHTDVTLLDIAEPGLAATRARLGATPCVHYEIADVTTWRPSRAYALWHDRALFHFLISSNARAAYRAALLRAIRPDGHVILGTFAEDGPDRCSGLPVQRYSSDALAGEFAGVLQPIEARTQQHRTPTGMTQSFLFVRFQRRASGAK